MRQAEIYTPDIDWTTGAYGNGGGTWTVDGANAANVRNYHSTALLLPNGKVWTAGGNVDAQSGDPNVVGVKRIELYEPAYIAVANRLQIQSAPVLLAYGEDFTVQVDQAATNVSRAALIRNSSVTHATDNDQRYVGLAIVSRSGNSIRFRAPPNGNVAPPGYYMLWLVDAAGNPCQLARFVRLAHLSCRVIANRSTFSEEEVQALGGGANAVFGGSLYVDFDGFIASEISGTPSFTLEWGGGGGAIPADQLALQFSSRYSEANPPEPDVPTRVTYAFDLVFPTMGAYAGWIDRRSVIVRFTHGVHVCQAELELSKSPNPYMIDIDPVAHNADWLSTDVRVFKVRMNETRFGSTVGSNPNAYIRQVVDRLRSGAESFGALPAEGAGTVLSGAFMAGFPMEPVFNFAVARIRYRATSTIAQSVRCFFRLCNVAATGLQFDTNTVYRRTPGPNPVPLLGTAGGQIVSIPFFNAPRIASVVGQAGAASMANQVLDPNYDIQNIVPAGSGAEVSAYFGVFLDLNLPTKRFPVAPANDGPFAEATAVPIRDLLRSWHNCLVAEIFFDPDPTRAGAGPADSDNLSQRNLAIVGLENPGLAASRTAMHTFEIAPSLIDEGEPIFNPTLQSMQHDFTFVRKRAPYPDELFFDWHNLPAATEVTLYFSDIDTAAIQDMLVSRISAPAFTILDSKSIRFKVGDCAWLPIPAGRSIRIPALISITLPGGIVAGQVYRATIRQVNGRTGVIIGSVTIEMPVSKADFLRPEAEQQLSFMGHIAKTLPSNDRWKPIFDRLIAHLAARVDALGGASSQVEPNPDGSGKPYVPVPWRPGDPFPQGGFGSGTAGGGQPTGPDAGADCGCCWPGWIVAAALVVALTAIGFLPAAFVLPLVAVLLLVAAVAGYCWSSICKGRYLCSLIDHIVLASTLSVGILALGSIGFGAAVHPLSLVISGAIAVLAIVAAYFIRCRGRCCD